MKKSQFKTQSLRSLKKFEEFYYKNIFRILSKNKDEVIIAKIPKFASPDKKIRPLILNKEIIKKIIKDHGTINYTNFVINANDWDFVIINVDGNKDKINLIKIIENTDNFFTIGANRINGYFIVTHYETSSKNSSTLKNLLKNKGDSLNHAGRAACPSFATSSNEDACQLGLSGVSTDST